MKLKKKMQAASAVEKTVKQIKITDDLGAIFVRMAERFSPRR